MTTRRPPSTLALRPAGWPVIILCAAGPNRAWTTSRDEAAQKLDGALKAAMGAASGRSH